MVRPGESIQAALEQAANDPVNKHVRVMAGTYRPARHAQAMIWFNDRHDGILLEAVGDVTLTAANPKVSRPDDVGHPAVVNHVVYFGDGISSDTVLRGFTITGANNYVTWSDDPLTQPEIGVPGLEKDRYFYTDGGGIKIFGRSAPTIERCVVTDNYASPCAAGVSIEHRGHNQHPAILRDCVFRQNRSPVTGPAVDLLHGSAAILDNCLFVGNLSGTPMDDRSRFLGKWRPEHGSGALTVFPKSRVEVRRCTFTGNRSGVDDASGASIYESCIFWANNVAGGWAPGEKYEADLAPGTQMTRCFLGGGGLVDLRETIDKSLNHLDCSDPQFNEAFEATAPEFSDAGYRRPSFE